ncbi:MAG TPA: type II secretion system F family protein [Candidatus Sulfopaludibacter sp.]|jgi:tight adherence protein B|nr:type II secretion system F family protein [Candidatus Sulfopaludibacter sp.]
MLILILFPIAIFATVALLLYLFMGGKDKATKQTLTRLDSIGLGPQSPQNDQIDIRRDDTYSTVAWLDTLLRKTDYTRALQLKLYQAELSWTPEKLLKLMLVAGITLGGLVYLRTETVFLTSMMFVLGASMPYLYVRHRYTKRFEKMRERLPESLDLMVSAIRAGHSFTSAMGLASRESPEPVKREFRQCFDEQNFGLDLRMAMNNLAYRMPIRDVRMIVTAVLIQKEAGGNLTEILDKVAYLIREDYRIQRQVSVHTAQGRITGYILAGLPVFLGILLYFVNPENMSLLWRRSVGIKLLETAAVMETIGLLIIRKIIQPKL